MEEETVVEKLKVIKEAKEEQKGKTQQQSYGMWDKKALPIRGAVQNVTTLIQERLSYIMSAITRHLFWKRLFTLMQSSRMCD